MDRKLADEIQKRLDQIREDIKTKGFSRVKVDSKVFRINTVDDITGKK